jgi:hypothetical protein
MSLASIVVVVCALLTPVPQSGPVAVAQDQNPATTSTEPAQEKPTPAPIKKPTVKKPAAKKKTTAKKKQAAKVPDPKSEDVPEKRVIRNGSATDPTTQISPSVPPQQASSQIQNTNTLLTTADENLKKISGTQLNTDQEDMVKQIHTYMEQAKAAAGAGDVERANNLATKAQLLSAELVKK